MLALEAVDVLITDDHSTRAAKPGPLAVARRPVDGRWARSSSTRALDGYLRALFSETGSHEY